MDSMEDSILAGLFLCEQESNEILAALRPDLNENIALPKKEKLALFHVDAARIIPSHASLSGLIDQEKYCISLLQQPGLFLRVRPGKYQRVLSIMETSGLVHEWLGDDCLRLKNSTSLEDIFVLNKEVVVQDYNSQQVLHYLQEQQAAFFNGQRVSAWDCCAASGGKSVLLFDILKGNVNITVSDIRITILQNLAQRLRQAGININRSFVADLASANVELPDDEFSVIICDAPCTGSGTWSRTPEQLYYFKEKQIEIFASRQQQIVTNVVKRLKPGGLFFYITCSVFRQENEELAAFISEHLSLNLLQQEYLKGYEISADTMFVAVFSKPLLP
jgi:16S rRNA (cytosine967-C5)-methyltransferase